MGANLINCTHHAGLIRNAILRGWRCDGLAEAGDRPLSESAGEAILAACLADGRRFSWLETAAGIRGNGKR